MTADMPQAESIVRVIAEAQDGLATKHDLFEVKNDLRLNRWMLGVLLVGVISLVLKAFFPY